jgi:hypothetical protein
VGNGTYSNDNRLAIAWRYPGNWTLQISSVELQDTGCYQCQVDLYCIFDFFFFFSFFFLKLILYSTQWLFNWPTHPSGPALRSTRIRPSVSSSICTSEVSEWKSFEPKRWSLFLVSQHLGGYPNWPDYWFLYTRLLQTSFAPAWVLAGRESTQGHQCPVWESCLRSIYLGIRFLGLYLRYIHRD